MDEKETAEKETKGLWRALLIAALGLGVSLLFFGPSLKEQLNGSPSKKRSEVRIQVINWQRAAMSYAENHRGIFPATSTDQAFRGFYCAEVQSKVTAPPINPFSQKAEWPIDGKVKSIEEAIKQENAEIPKGTIEYTAILNEKGIPVSFCLRAGDANGKALKSGTGENIVHSAR